MIYVTGDTHRDIDWQKLILDDNETFNKSNLTKNDYVIICGDFGGIWSGKERDQLILDQYDRQPWTTLFIDGNHENFDLLKKYPIEEKFGNYVTKISDSVYHLRRGNVYTIDNKTFFVMGGAKSHDKAFRTPYIGWWPEEMPNYQEYNNALWALESVNWEVDYVLTHCAPSNIQQLINKHYEPDVLTIFLENISNDLKFKTWYFGHYHIDFYIDKFQCLYNRILPIGE